MKYVDSVLSKKQYQHLTNFRECEKIDLGKIIVIIGYEEQMPKMQKGAEKRDLSEAEKILPGVFL
jgi:hypothetical protein